MRHASLIACLLMTAAASVMASPWSRFRDKIAPRPVSKSSQWVDEQEIGPYRIRSEFPLKDVESLVQDLADLQDDLERTLNLKCHPESIQVYLFSRKRSYDDYVRVRVPEGVNRQALYVPGPGANAGRIYAYRHRDLDTDVRHETTHALLHSALPYVPIWIDEGLAEYFEVPESLRVKGHSHRAELRSAISRQRWVPEIEKLEAKRKLMDMGRDDYRDSWGVVHYLLNGPPEAQRVLDRYFEEIQSGAKETPISELLHRRIPNAERAIVEHLKK